MVRTITAAALLLLTLGIGIAVPYPPVTPASQVPVCPEDAVAVGYGDYVGGIGWDRYQCIAIDDIVTGS